MGVRGQWPLRGILVRPSGQGASRPGLLQGQCLLLGGGRVAACGSGASVRVADFAFGICKRTPAVGRARPLRHAFIRTKRWAGPGVAPCTPPPPRSPSPHILPRQHQPEVALGLRPAPHSRHGPPMSLHSTPADARRWPRPNPGRCPAAGFGQRDVGRLDAAAAAPEAFPQPRLSLLGTLGRAPETRPATGLGDEVHAAEPRSTGPGTAGDPDGLRCCATSPWQQVAAPAPRPPRTHLLHPPRTRPAPTLGPRHARVS